MSGGPRNVGGSSDLRADPSQAGRAPRPAQLDAFVIAEVDRGTPVADDDEIASVEDFELLHEIDVFNTKIKQAVTALERNWGRRLPALLLYAHGNAVMPDSPLVTQLALASDERTEGKRRREIAQRMATAGAMEDASLERLRKRLSAARHDRGDLTDADESLENLTDDEFEDEMEVALGAGEDDETLASVVLARLINLGVLSGKAVWRLFDTRDAGRFGVCARCDPSESETDASALKTDASAVKTDG
jgi:hypothetical protein